MPPAFASGKNRRQRAKAVSAAERVSRGRGGRTKNIFFHPILDDIVFFAKTGSIKAVLRIGASDRDESCGRGRERRVRLPGESDTKVIVWN